jgi:hypothetical protein
MPAHDGSACDAPRPEAASRANELQKKRQESEGGPRAGMGAAVDAAMCAAAMGRTAWASGMSMGKSSVGVTGGAPASMHSGQSMWPAPSSCAPSSVCTMALTEPVAEHTSSIACGCTTGEAMAAPRDSANHSSTQRIRPVAGRLTPARGAGVWVAACRLMGADYRPARCGPRKKPCKSLTCKAFSFCWWLFTDSNRGPVDYDFIGYRLRRTSENSLEHP